MSKHSLANYPTDFKGTVISPTKICLQFSNVQVKLRRNEQADGLAKMPDTVLALPIKVTGTDIDTCAVGCQLPVLEDLQLRLITAYRSYHQYHKERYKQEYGKDFVEFLVDAHESLGVLLHDIYLSNSPTSMATSCSIPEQN